MSQISPNFFRPSLYFLETTEGGKGEGKIKSSLNEMQQKNSEQPHFSFLRIQNKDTIHYSERITMHISITTKSEPNR